AFGAASLRSDDTLDAVLAAPDRAGLLDWLLCRPLLHEDERLRVCMVHAGLVPQWDLPLARNCAREFEQALRREPEKLFADLYGDQPDRWSDAHDATERLRFIANCLTRLRYLDADGRLALRAKGSPRKAQSKLLVPWFEARCARWRGSRIVFGHWSTLGFFKNDDVTGIDTGCVWGGSLTALRLDQPDADPVQVPSMAKSR
ncbi:MAG TPA: symmetrical bis(5'-nucleosyl)-tetraphosphatase, partial [Steroidobacteraceae bacterium]